jgi:hypothetical protein
MFSVLVNSQNIVFIEPVWYESNGLDNTIWGTLFPFVAINKHEYPKVISVTVSAHSHPKAIPWHIYCHRRGQHCASGIGLLC